ncbi:MAG: tRNA (adenosine(37)-N6)-dimethylallyltransferase MiaA [Clostridia bacterium]|nr:tRNA (adenosine(37)-N6)-dimethylallyltransferase MiaA [Clostridia bacterium]
MGCEGSKNAPIRVVAVSGPTAGGKTGLAIALAKALDGEIVCCDSMQIYRGMDVGTAKPTAEELAAVPHHMVNILEPTESFSAADYAVLAEKAVTEIAFRGRLPILCGGTGLYLEALRTDRHGTPMACDEEYRASLLRMAEAEGKEAVHALLAEVDPASAATTHPNNLRRVVRALEIYHVTGKTKTETDREAATENPRLSLLNLTLFYRNRAILYDRIDRRVEQMMWEGLLEETERLYRTGRLVPGTTAAAAIGYKECLGAVTGEMTAEEAVETLKNATHHYAKRQETWFSAHPHLPLYADDENGMRPFEEVLAEAKAQVLSFLKA